MKKAIIFCLLSILWCSIISAQTNQIVDSLKTALTKTTHDTFTLKVLTELSDLAPDGEWQNFNQQMKLLALKCIENNNAKVRLVGKTYYAVSLNNNAYEYAESGDYKSALECYAICDSINLEIGDYENLSLVSSNVGAIYDRMGDTASALINYKRALEYVKRSGSLKNLVALYTNLGTLSADINSKYNYYLMAYNIVKEQNLKNQIVTVLFEDLGSVEVLKGNTNKAEEYFNKGLKMAIEIGDKLGEAGCLHHLGLLLNQKGKQKEALVNLERALTIAQEANFHSQISSIASNLRPIYKQKGDFMKAYKMFELEDASNKILTKIENKKAVLKHQFETEYKLKKAIDKAEQAKKENIHHQKLSRQKTVRNGFIVGFIIMLTFASVFLKQRNKIKEGKNQSDALLLNILPEEVAEELKDKGYSTAKHYNNVTVLFTDFVNFTGISQTLTPENLVQEIHKNFTAFDGIIEQYGLEKIKTIGDAYLAVCGLPEEDPNHAQNVIKAAIKIQQFIKQNNGLFKVRIGVNSGSVVAGIVGVKKYAYDIWGDTVNTAARMEQNCEAGKINISDSTYALAKNEFSFTHRGKIAAKNKGDVDMYYVNPL